VEIDIFKKDGTVNVVSCDGNTFRCYRECLVTDLIKNILDMDSLWISWFVTDVSGKPIRQNSWVKHSKNNSSWNAWYLESKNFSSIRRGCGNQHF